MGSLLKWTYIRFRKNGSCMNSRFFTELLISYFQLSFVIFLICHGGQLRSEISTGLVITIFEIIILNYMPWYTPFAASQTPGLVLNSRKLFETISRKIFCHKFPASDLIAPVTVTVSSTIFGCYRWWAVVVFHGSACGLRGRTTCNESLIAPYTRIRLNWLR